MEDLTKDDLLNAGWIENGDSEAYLQTENHKIYIKLMGRYTVIIDSGEDQGVTALTFYAKTKSVLNKMCYPFLGKDLDFSPKKDYSWEGVFSAMGVEQDKMCVEFFYSLLRVDLLTKKEKKSIEAGFKLRIIIKQINEDFPSVDEYYYYPYINEEGEIDSLETMCKCNNIVCESIDGFDKLVDTNRPLLKQYFGIE